MFFGSFAGFLIEIMRHFWYCGSMLISHLDGEAPETTETTPCGKPNQEWLVVEFRPRKAQV